MKIFFVQGDYNFCYYYRGYLTGVYTGNPVISEFVSGNMDIDWEKYKPIMLEADIIVFQRPTGRHAYEFAKVLKQAGKYIIMDNDDTYSGVPLYRLGNEKRVQMAKMLNSNLNAFCKLADGIVTSTKFLADEYSLINPNVAIAKNCIDPLDEWVCKKNTTGKFRIGFIGSVTTNDDYFHIKDQIRKLDERGDVTIVVLGVKLKNGKLLTQTLKEDADFWSSLKNVEWHPLCNVTEYMYKVSQLALDVAIIPRKDHYFNKCKSNLKYLEMSLLRIPVLAQAFPDGLSPYQSGCEHLTLVHDNALWYDSIIDIKNNYDKYKDMANKAHDFVLENYNIKTYAPEWVNIIKNLCKYQQNS